MYESLWIQIHLVEKYRTDQEEDVISSVRSTTSYQSTSTVEKMSPFSFYYMHFQQVEQLQRDIKERVIKILCRKGIEFDINSFKIEFLDDFPTTRLPTEIFFRLLRRSQVGTRDIPLEVTVSRKEKTSDIIPLWTALPSTHNWTSYSVLEQSSCANSYSSPYSSNYERPIWTRQERFLAGSKNSFNRLIRSISSSYLKSFPFEYEDKVDTKPMLLTLVEEGPNESYMLYKTIFVRTCFPILYDRIICALFCKLDISEKRIYLAGGYGVGQSTFLRYLIYRLYDEDIGVPLSIVWDQGGKNLTLIDHNKKVWIARRTPQSFEKELSSLNTLYIYDPLTTFKNPIDVNYPLNRSGPLTGNQAKQIIVSGPFTFYLDPPVEKQMVVILPPWEWDELRGCRATCGAAERVCKDTLETLNDYWGGSIKYVLSCTEEEAIEKVKAIVRQKPLQDRFKQRSLCSPLNPRDLVFQLNDEGKLSLCSNYVKSKLFVAQ
jgi:hypothetical protein